MRPTRDRKAALDSSCNRHLLTDGSGSRIARRVSSLARELWRDERGTVSWISMIMTTVVVAFGAIVGLATLRDHVLQQYGDVAVGLDHLDQSWAYKTGIDLNGDGDCIDPGECEFEGEFVDSSTLVDPPGAAPADLVFFAP